MLAMIPTSTLYTDKLLHVYREIGCLSTFPIFRSPIISLTSLLLDLVDLATVLGVADMQSAQRTARLRPLAYKSTVRYHEL